MPNFRRKGNWIRITLKTLNPTLSMLLTVEANLA